MKRQNNILKAKPNTADFNNKSNDSVSPSDSISGMGTLYVVATPIGNLEDITLRAVRTLKESELILCENVSEASRLLKHYEVSTPTTNYFANSKISKLDKIMDMLADGKVISLISDAGTPAVSDPGAMLIHEIRTHLPDVKIITIPGASAVTAAFSISGVYGNNFLFLGFAPQKKGRETFFNELADSKYNVVFYESVHRIEKCLQNIKSSLESKYSNDQVSTRKIIVARELTKIYEQAITGNIYEIIDYFTNNKDKIRGEFVVIVEGI